MFVDLVAKPEHESSRPDLFNHTRDTLSEATLLLLLGQVSVLLRFDHQSLISGAQEYVSKRNMRIVEDVSNGMAQLTGQYQNFSFVGKYLPWLWVLLTWSVPRRIKHRQLHYEIQDQRNYNQNSIRLCAAARSPSVGRCEQVRENCKEVEGIRTGGEQWKILHR